jgi:hypothetical protein
VGPPKDVHVHMVKGNNNIDVLKMSLGFLEHNLGTISPVLHNFIGKELIKITIFLRLVSYFNHKYNKRCFT